jgi:hypothetical protein
MSNKRNDPKGNAGGEGEAEVLARLTEAWSKAGEVIPTSEAEVARAEAEGAAWEGPLPQGLAGLRPAAGSVRSPESTRHPEAAGGTFAKLPDDRGRIVPIAEARRPRSFAKSLATHAIAVGLGAAAAAALFVLAERPRDRVSTNALPAGELAPPPREDAAPPTPSQIAVDVPPECPGSQCCAGTRCESAKGDLRTCPSGRTCVSCNAQDMARSRYRLKVASVTLAEAGTRMLQENPKGAFAMCFRAGGSETACVGLPENADEKEAGMPLPFVVSAQDLNMGLEMTFRFRGMETPLAHMRTPVQLNATVLCHGLSLKPTLEDQLLATVFVVLADTHYVELSRGGAVDELLTYEKRFDLRGVSPHIFETRLPQAERFALVLGPVDLSTAESIRWKLLDQGEQARITVGTDHIGQPRKP